MGIINCTPDSFFSGSRQVTIEAALGTAMEMIADGADVLDLGGESSRPGAEYVEAQEEMDRLVPVIEEIRKHTDIPLSVDTRKASVAEACFEAGADILNDISALEDDEALIPLLNKGDWPVILMHKRGVPKDMQKAPTYVDPVGDIIIYLQSRVEYAISHNITKDRIILDPGIGFGKRLQDNLSILKSINRFHELGLPLLIGASRKSFIGTILENEPEDRLYGSLGAHAWSVAQGAQIVRVHDVKATSEMIRIIDEIKGVETPK